MNRILLYLVISANLLAVASCKKNHETDLLPNLNTANDIMLAQRPFIHVFDMLIKAALDEGLQNNFQAQIDSASVVLDTGRKKYVFYYFGKLCPDSVRRIGSFQAILDGSLFTPGTTVKISFVCFVEDSHSVTAKDSLRFDGPGQDEKLVFRSIIADAQITKDTIGVIRWEGTYTFLIDPEILSQGTKKTVVHIEGSGEGISSMGWAFYSSIANPLRDSLGCPWIKDGKVTFYLSRGEVNNNTIEFMGKSQCNNRINYDFDGNIYHWWLKEKYLVK